MHYWLCMCKLDRKLALRANFKKVLILMHNEILEIIETEAMAKRRWFTRPWLARRTATRSVKSYLEKIGNERS